MFLVVPFDKGLRQSYELIFKWQATTLQSLIE